MIKSPGKHAYSPFEELSVLPLSEQIDMGQIAFAKWAALGNDFVMLWNLKEIPEPSLSGKLAKLMCERHFGIGADGLIFAIRESDDTVLRMEIYNADGSLAAMCGNGIRCLAALASGESWCRQRQFYIETRSGRKEAAIESYTPWSVRVDMGEPVLVEEGHSTLTNGTTADSVIVNTGNLHRVIFTDNLADIDICREGSFLENAYSQGTNVEFIQVNPDNSISCKVWERGAGETLACGTGACAVLFAAYKRNLSPQGNTIHLPGGDLFIRLKDNRLHMTGPACEVFRGVYLLKDM